MKKTAIALAVAFTGLATVVQAAPSDKSWYVGGKVGWSEYSKRSTNAEFSGLPSNYDFEKQNQVGAGAFVGFQHNKYLGFELGYDWLGKLDKLPAEAKDAGNKAEYFAHGFSLATKLSYPIVNNLDIYTRLGGIIWLAETKFTPTGGETKKTNEYGISPLAAVGLDYAINDKWSTRLDYQWIWHIGDKDSLGVRPNNQLLSVGVAYHFASAPKVLPVPLPIPQKSAPQQFNLKSDVLFNFNQSNLKPEGRHALDQLYGQLNQVAPNKGSVIVIGHTDRIGSAQYNQRLSEKRAHSVVNYLVSKGVPPTNIAARGVGKNNPVTGNKCHGISHKSALITCLAPDRRVEVVIDGSH